MKEQAVQVSAPFSGQSVEKAAKGPGPDALIGLANWSFGNARFTMTRQSERGRATRRCAAEPFTGIVGRASAPGAQEDAA